MVNVYTTWYEHKLLVFLWKRHIFNYAHTVYRDCFTAPTQSVVTGFTAPTQYRDCFAAPT